MRSVACESPATLRLNVLVLYDNSETHISTVREYLEAFAKYSRHQVFYAIATKDAPCAFDLELFDAVLIHYSVRLSLPQYISAHYAERLATFQGCKILFIQDEYENTEQSRKWMERLRLDVVFSCVPQESIDVVYPPARFPATRFVTALTGFVPEAFEAWAVDPEPERRKIFLGYRGRPLPFWYGALGQEKLEIGRRARAHCEERGVAVDIEWQEEHRIYGDGWYPFVASCRAMLATESGANVFDWDGSLRASIEAALAENPGLTFEEARERFLADRDGAIAMNQISPKVFEAIAMRTALVMFEGNYSGVVQPGVHYIALRKDFANFDEVLATLRDSGRVRELTERAYNDVIRSGRYSYAAFVAQVDDALAAHVREPKEARLFTSVVAAGGPKGEQSFGTLAAVPELVRVGPYAHVVSSRFLPSALPWGRNFSDRVPEVPDYEARPPVIIKVPTDPKPQEFLPTIRTKLIVRELLLRLWAEMPGPLSTALRPFMTAVRAAIRRLWR